MFHQAVCGFHGGGGDASYEVFRRMLLLEHFFHEIHRSQNTSFGCWMGGKHNGISRLQRDDGFVDGCGSGIGRRHKACDDPHWNPDLVDFLFMVFMDESYGLHIFDAFIENSGSHQVFHGLVRHISVSGLFHCHFCQGFGFFVHPSGQSKDHPVHLRLTVILEFFLRRLCFSDKIPHFLQGCQIPI